MDTDPKHCLLLCLLTNCTQFFTRYTTKNTRREKEEVEKALERISISQALEVSDDILYADVGPGDEAEEPDQEQDHVLEYPHPAHW